MSKKNRPMLYIDQPEFGEPNVRMQQFFVTKPDKKEKEKVTRLEERVETNQSNDHIVESNDDEDNDDIQKEVPQTAVIESKTMIDEDEEEKNKLQGKKGFKELSIEEKVYYLLNLPFGVPDIKCEFKTDNQNYRGIVNDYKEGQLKIRLTTNLRFVTVDINDVNEIQMLGF